MNLIKDAVMRRISPHRIGRHDEERKMAPENPTLVPPLGEEAPGEQAKDKERERSREYLCELLLRY